MGKRTECLTTGYRFSVGDGVCSFFVRRLRSSGTTILFVHRAQSPYSRLIGVRHSGQGSPRSPATNCQTPSLVSFVQDMRFASSVVISAIARLRLGYDYQ